jgi:hypothetical protein
LRPDSSENLVQINEAEIDDLKDSELELEDSEYNLIEDDEDLSSRKESSEIAKDSKQKSFSS